MELQFIKIDKNGTKIYHDWTCPRCGGAGESEAWAHTGRTCYECEGSGRRHKPAIVKHYTPEHEAKLNAKREKRIAERIEKAKVEDYPKALKRNGFGEDGVGYVYTGNTFAIKDELKAGGARFSFALHWVSPKPIADFPCIEIRATDVIDWFHSRYDLSNPKCEAWLAEHGIEF
ncbi:MAG: hypothetical protein IJX94_01505 [Clostridia bacterium]|nr:hypothetical protein [Clostridia bacterium]